MKSAEKHISTFLISIAVFLVFGNVAFGNVVFSDTSKVVNFASFEGDEDGKPFVFDELSIQKVSPTVSQNEYLGVGFVGIFFSNKNFTDVQIPTSFKCSYSLKDKREIIFQYLFPFHFFW